MNVLSDTFPSLFPRGHIQFFTFRSHCGIMTISYLYRFFCYLLFQIILYHHLHLLTVRWGGWGREMKGNWSTERLHGLLKVTWAGPRTSASLSDSFSETHSACSMQEHRTPLSSHCQPCSWGPSAPRESHSLPSLPAHLVPGEPGISFLTTS